MKNQEIFRKLTEILSFEVAIYQCDQEKCKNTWIEDTDDYKHCPYCSWKYDAIVLKKQTVSVEVA